MLTFEEGLVVELSTISGLSGKIYPLQAPQGTQAPYLCYNLGSQDRTMTLSGFDGLTDPQFDINVYHSGYGTLKSLMALVVAEIKTWLFTSIGTSGPYIQDIEILNQFETYEDALGLHRGIIEIDVRTRE